MNELIERTESVLRDCVERQLIGDVNLGILLSGGIDSTLAAKYASDFYTSSGRIIQGFSLINTRFKNFNEENYIDHVASRINIDLNKYDFDDISFLSSFEQSIYASETIIHATSMGTY